MADFGRWRKRLESALNEIVAPHGFCALKRRDSIEFARNVEGKVLQIIYASETRGGRLRLEVFAVLLQEPTSAIGGRLTSSSILSEGNLGGDQTWSLDGEGALSEMLGTVLSALLDVALPWFAVLTDESVLKARVRNGKRRTQYEISVESYPKAEIPVISATNIRSGLKFADLGQLQVWVNRYIDDFLAANGFTRVPEEQIAYFRQRERVGDVLAFELINSGLHVGVNAFNWIPEVALDGSAHYSRESTLMLNGGPVCIGGHGSPYGTALLLGDDEHARYSLGQLKNEIETQVLPKLCRVQSKSDFLESIHPGLRALAAGVPGLMS